MRHPENKAALVWFSQQLCRYESEQGHAEIVVKVKDGKVCRVEPGEKVNIEQVMKNV